MPPSPVLALVSDAGSDRATCGGSSVEEGRHSASSQGLSQTATALVAQGPSITIPVGPPVALPVGLSPVTLQWLASHSLDPAEVSRGLLDDGGEGILHRLASDCKKRDMVQVLLQLAGRLPVSAFSQRSRGKFVDWEPLHVLANNKAMSPALSQAEGTIMRMMIGAHADIDAPGAYRC